MNRLLVESSSPILSDYVEEFCLFSCEKLGIVDCPPVTFVERTGNASFGSYSPSDGTVIVATEGRHVADILRTLCHEFVHDAQITNGSQLPLLELEAEANAVAGLLLRDWNKAHPELYGTNTTTHDDAEHESFGATAADPTRPSGPIELAELSNKTLASYKRKAKGHLKHRLRDYGRGREYYGIEFFHNPGLGPKREQGIKTAETKLRKRYAVQEDAPVNAAGSGEIAGIGVGPQGEPGIKKSKMIRRKPKSGLATIFAGFPRKTLKEYKAHITKKLNWNEIEKDTVSMSTPLVTPKKNLGFLWLPHKSLKQFLKGK
jgi:hypothetical protein